jgi:hypothetical protein
MNQSYETVLKVSLYCSVPNTLSGPPIGRTLHLPRRLSKNHKLVGFASNKLDLVPVACHEANICFEAVLQVASVASCLWQNENL